MHYKR